MVRVIQWSTGRVGSACVRAIHGNPDLELVAVATYDPDKIGKDAGVIAGIGEIGVPLISTSEAASRDADCVVHTPRGEMFRDQAVDEITSLLKSGKSVVSTSMMSLTHPRTMEPEYRAAIEQACIAGNSAFHGTGINPGFFADLVTAFLSGLCTEVNRVHSFEIYDYENHSSHATIVTHLGYGRPIEEQMPMPPQINRRSGVSAMYVLADLLGFELESVRGVREMHPAPFDFEIRSAKIGKGTIAGRREIYTGTVEGKDVITFEFVHRARADMAPHWAGPAKDGVHRFENHIFGTPNVVSAIELGHDDPQHIAGAIATGMRAVNSVSSLVNLAPGIHTMADLPMLTAPLVVR